jgi:hypothetical protein
MGVKGDLIAISIAGVVLVAAAWYAKKKAGQVVDTVLDASKYVNPVSDQNLAYQGASSMARWLTGQETGDLGTIAWDYMHKAEPLPGGGGGLVNYTAAQAAADAAATRQLEAGFHGM